MPKEIDYSQYYCSDCLFCGYDVFACAFCFSKNKPTTQYTKACEDDFKDKYDEQTKET